MTIRRTLIELITKLENHPQARDLDLQILKILACTINELMEEDE